MHQQSPTIQTLSIKVLTQLCVGQTKVYQACLLFSVSLQFGKVRHMKINPGWRVMCPREHNCRGHRQSCLNWTAWPQKTCVGDWVPGCLQLTEQKTFKTEGKSGKCRVIAELRGTSWEGHPGEWVSCKERIGSWETAVGEIHIGCYGAMKGTWAWCPVWVLVLLFICLTSGKSLNVWEAWVSLHKTDLAHRDFYKMK